VAGTDSGRTGCGDPRWKRSCLHGRNRHGRGQTRAVAGTAMAEAPARGYRCSVVATRHAFLFTGPRFAGDRRW